MRNPSAKVFKFFALIVWQTIFIAIQFFASCFVPKNKVCTNIRFLSAIQLGFFFKMCGRGESCVFIF